MKLQIPNLTGEALKSNESSGFHGSSPPHTPAIIDLTGLRLILFTLNMLINDGLDFMKGLVGLVFSRTNFFNERTNLTLSILIKIETVIDFCICDKRMNIKRPTIKKFSKKNRFL